MRDLNEYNVGTWKISDDGNIEIQTDWMYYKRPFISFMRIGKGDKLSMKFIKATEREYKKGGKIVRAYYSLPPARLPDGSIVAFTLGDDDKNPLYAKIDRGHERYPFEIIEGGKPAVRKVLKALRSGTEKAKLGKLEKTEKKKKATETSETEKMEKPAPSELKGFIAVKFGKGARIGARDSREIRILSSEPDLSEIKGVGPSITQAVTDIYGTTSVSELLKVDGFLESLGDIRTDRGRKIPKSTLNNIRKSLLSLTKV